MKNIVVAHDLSFQPMISEAEIKGRVRELGQLISKRYRGKNPIFLAVLNGAFIFAADLVRACDMDCEVSFIKLKSYEGAESSGEVAQHIGLEMDVDGRAVILVEDIIDSGKTMAEFLPKLRELNPVSVEIVSLLFKPESLEHDLEIGYVGFEIPPRFVIGYGLDYDGLGRNLPDIYQLIE
jgi:hypoxanthine phosphoribosyltransferase